MDVLPLIVFVLSVIIVILLVVFEPSFPVPQSWRQKNAFWKFLGERKIDYSMIPCIGVVLLLCTTSISFEDAWNGIKGDHYIKPYAIIILFQSLAYVCVSLDLTGVFAYLALVMTRAAKGSGWRLFMYYFTMSSIMTIVTSNDIVILTLTPIIVYCMSTAKADP